MPSPTAKDASNELIKKLLEGLEAAHEALTQTRNEIAAQGREQDKLEAQLEQVIKTVDRLVAVVVDGAGHKPLTERVLLLEEWQRNISKEAPFKWGLAGTIISAFAAIIAAVITLLKGKT